MSVTREPEVIVIGLGRMGRAYLGCLERQGVPVRGTELASWQREPDVRAPLAVLALRSGTDTRRMVSQATSQSVGQILDLTTQAVDDSEFCVEAARRAGIGYFGGGVTGGAAEAHKGTLGLLLGPALPPEVAVVAEKLGTVVGFTSAATATAAKLLHNFVLILHNHSLAIALRLAEEMGVEELEAVLDAGTAGRIPSRSSVVRDYRTGPVSSYTGNLVAKDLHAILTSFPRLEGAIGVNLHPLIELYGEGGDAPYTVTALRGALTNPRAQSDDK